MNSELEKPPHDLLVVLRNADTVEIKLDCSEAFNSYLCYAVFKYSQFGRMIACIYKRRTKYYEGV